MNENHRIVQWIKITDTHATFKCANGRVQTAKISDLKIKREDMQKLKEAFAEEDADLMRQALGLKKEK